MERDDVIKGLNESYAKLQTYLDPEGDADIIARINAVQGDPTTDEVVDLLQDMCESVRMQPFIPGEYGATPPESYPETVIASEYLRKYRDPNYQTIWEAYGIA